MISDDHYHLLQAGLAPADRAREAFARVQTPLAALDLGARRLLPLIYHNTGEPSLKPGYLDFWTSTEKLYRALRKVLTRFHEAGLPAALLKGAAVVELAYKDCALRPMSDVDLLVRFEHAARAWQLLEDSGYRSEDPLPRELTLRYRHAQAFVHPDGSKIDLHWRLLAEGLGGRSPLRWRAPSRAEAWQEDLWSRALACQVQGAHAYVLDPTDTLFHTLVHGLEANSVPSSRWVADAVWLIRERGAEISWDRLTDRAGQSDLIGAAKAALDILRKFDVQVPALVFPPSTWTDRGWHMARTRSPSPWTVAIRLFLEGLRKLGAGDLGIADMPRFLQSRLGLARAGEIPQHLCQLLRGALIRESRR